MFFCTWFITLLSQLLAFSSASFLHDQLSSQKNQASRTREESSPQGWFSSFCYLVVVNALVKHERNMRLREPGGGKCSKKCLALLCVKVIWPTVWELANKASDKSHGWAHRIRFLRKGLNPSPSPPPPPPLFSPQISTFFSLSYDQQTRWILPRLEFSLVLRTDREFHILWCEGGQGSK